MAASIFITPGGWSISGSTATFVGSAVLEGGTLTCAAVNVSASGSFFWTGRSEIRSPADAQLNILNNANTVGVGLDASTNAVLKVRTTAQNAYATVDCLGLKASGSAGASGTGTVISAITVVNGIITAISVT